jgi:hypothetical protein
VRENRRCGEESREVLLEICQVLENLRCKLYQAPTGEGSNGEGEGGKMYLFGCTVLGSRD